MPRLFSRRQVQRFASSMGLALFLSATLTSVADAQALHAAAPSEQKSVSGDLSSPRSPAEKPNPARLDREKFDYSGTRGRMGLGADAIRPEGPGNVSN
jgi:hypothetical protein